LAGQVTRTFNENYGVAFAPFIAHVVENRPPVLRTFVEDKERFVDQCAPADNWERRYARKFGYAYAGGLPAVREGVREDLGWKAVPRVGAGHRFAYPAKRGATTSI